MSLSKNKISYIQSLKQKKYRNQHNTFVAEGSKLIFDLIRNTPCQLLVISDELKDSVTEVDAEEIIIASNAELKKASHLSTPPDAIAVFYQKNHDLTKIDYAQKLNLILDEIQDPGNLGTIIRIADWFGIENIFCSLDTVDVYNTKTVQATMGALSRVNVHYANIVDILNLHSHSPIFGTFLDGNDIYKESLSKEGFIVMGNEGKGISPAVEKLISNRLYIPNFSTNSTTSESLNVAVATAVVCSEFRRR
ncbi:MAG: RNA methyltransferase [Dysgonamonadaceae bacterium]|nr:RNA methyltransferase [Dysgonamonadaceae bacterium]MDD4246816.1 RNA methyltransferase [Dysgonamonadaceae bacterium]HUI33402.1 RNA methyltransferase [Dysgonamonadaceae bacterium]